MQYSTASIEYKNILGGPGWPSSADKWINEGIKERVNEWMKEWIKESIKEWLNETEYICGLCMLTSC